MSASVFHPKIPTMTHLCKLDDSVSLSLWTPDDPRYRWGFAGGMAEVLEGAVVYQERGQWRFRARCSGMGFYRLALFGPNKAYKVAEIVFDIYEDLFPETDEDLRKKIESDEDFRRFIAYVADKSSAEH